MKKLLSIWIFVLFLLVFIQPVFAAVTTKEGQQSGTEDVLFDHHCYVQQDGGMTCSGTYDSANFRAGSRSGNVNTRATILINLTSIVAEVINNATFKINTSSLDQPLSTLQMLVYYCNIYNLNSTHNWNQQPSGGTVNVIGNQCNNTLLYNKTQTDWKAGSEHNISLKIDNIIDFEMNDDKLFGLAFVAFPENVPAGNHFVIWNGLSSSESSWVFLDYVNITPIPPEITSYNMTSEGGEGCINWRTDKTNACSTGDTTPTVTFSTDESAFCTIGVSNLNYTDMGSSRNCTGGEGTTDHTCTLTPQDELTFEDSTIYLSCKDSSGNENLTSSSGALSLTITGLEAGGDAAIGVGVQNALLSGYTNYTNQQIYARKLDNTQDFGTFDWVAKKGSKVWAFNYISKGEQHVGLFNLTPVLYVLEMANITNSTIINTVELMINATK